MASSFSDEPLFLTREEILDLHRDMIESYSEGRTKSYEETNWIRDEVLLESALFAPQATFGGEFLFTSLAAMAAAYWHSLVTNHPFEDGNKRVGLMAAAVFLYRHGFELSITEEQAEELTIAIASGRYSREEAIRLFEEAVVPRSI